MEPLLPPEGDPADAEAGYALLPRSPLPRVSSTPYVEKETSRTVRKLLARAGLGHAQPPPQQQQPATALHPAPPAAASTKDGLLEGLDFSLFASAVNLASLRPTSAWEWRLRALKRWLLCLATGVATALLATAIIFSTKHFAAVKSNAVAAFTAGIAGAPSSADVATAFALFAGLSVAFAVAAALIVAYLEPLAAGSGIPELAAYINGVNMPRLLRFKTLLAKVLALPLAMGSGLPVGYEGPMAHIGAACAAMVSQGKSNALGCGLPALPSATFRLDANKREFVCVGAAAGVAAAFNAPAGAVVFVIEEMGASVWQRGLLFRSFLTAIVAAYVIDFLLSGLQASSWGRLTAQGMFSFGLPDASEINADSAWCLYELCLFVILGGLGGASGALFNRASRLLLQLRTAYVAPSRLRRVLDVAAVSLLVSAVAFFLPLYAGACLEAREGSAAGASGAAGSGAFFCPQAPGQYNDLAALFFATPEEGIRLLFHEKAGTLSPRSLGLFWAFYLALMCICGGTSVPSGHFIPSLLAGCALGRLVGELARANAPAGFPLASPGAYAVIGAASMLGGILRLSLSMSVVLLEATGNAFFSLPLMATLMTARLVGDALSEGLYESQLAVRAWPVLEERPPRPLGYALRACDVMTAPPLVVPEVDTAGALRALLLSCTHGGFPVVVAAGAPGGAGGAGGGSAAGRGTLAGYIQRRHISVLLEQRAFHAQPPPPLSLGGASASASDSDSGFLQEQQQQPLQRVGAAAAHLPVPAPALAAGSLNGGGGALPRHPSDARLRLRVPSVAGPDSHVVLQELLLLGSMSPIGKGRSSSVTHLASPDAAGSSSSSSSSSSSESGFGLGGGGSSGGSGSAAPTSRSARPLPSSAAAAAASAATGAPLPPRPASPPAPSQRAVSRARLAARLAASLQGARAEALYSGGPALPASAFSAAYPRYPDVRALRLTPAEAAMHVDLRPYMDATPVTVHAQAPLERAHRLFCAMGLRHLVVVDDGACVVGVITRRELTSARLRALVDPFVGEEA